ncbi:MAG: protein-export membrane protein SecD [Deltaproteobacteria bacterium RIFOXYA12_FULL_58_15]|nr:MAG: protein-export membrane protein SecD [Deltaproteobacteria bacterium RIFOXYA12_FULL_58_15]OGR11577.1 MAG: protein-export membrane protein SecD [Deltaproteobacteria bacterium RIFOXYB12_FULL_58_9]
MTRGWYGRFALIAFVLGLAAYMLYPSYRFYFEASEQEREDNDKFCATLPSWATCTKFNLGLDLQGGVHLVMGVRVDKAVEHRADRLADALRDELKEQKITFSRIDRPRGSPTIRVTLAPEAESDAFEKYLRKDFGVLQITQSTDKVYELELAADEAEFVRENAVEQAIKTIRNRADKLGVTEPTIARRGTDNILIQLPGVKDPERAIALIGKTAQLEFKIVDDEGTAVFDDIEDSVLPEGTVRDEYKYDGPDGRQIREVFFKVPEAKKEELVALLHEKIPGNREIGFGEIKDQPVELKIPLVRTYLLTGRPGITGDYLTEARVQQDPDNPLDYYVTMTFDAKGGRVFEQLTSENVQRRMAIVLDGKVNSAPQIQEKIGGGTARITLGRGADAAAKLQEAKDLALVLKAGALPAPVEIREKRQVGRSLGQEAVRKGSVAIAVGGILVVLFMLVYYKGSGLLADLALVLNVFLLLAALAFLEGTLTLPGMAGIVLTIGMAVDANVIIFERVREELRIGKTPRAAIESGYGKAFRAIFDSNVTTLLAAVVLMQYGTGPLRGFAVTLFIGILCSMFTAIVITRLIFDFFTGRRRLRSLSI